MACTPDPEDSWPLWSNTTHKLKNPNPRVPSGAGTRKDKAPRQQLPGSAQPGKGVPEAAARAAHGASKGQATGPAVLALIHGGPEQGKPRREAACCHLVPKLRGTHTLRAWLPLVFAPGLDWNNVFGLFLLFLRCGAAGEDRAEQTRFTPGGVFQA